jgi:D-alanyl-D-alanine endopeptidase (penicillin-binding protein 7)
MNSAYLFVLYVFFSALVGESTAWANAPEPSMPKLRSSSVLVLDPEQDRPLYAKNPTSITPIASITKLMTAMVVLDAQLPLDERLMIDEADIDTIKGSQSRLRPGSELSRRELLRLALMSSENRAAAALGRNYPGGASAFVEAMNAKSLLVGMTRSHFADATGLSSDNVATAEDLARMVIAAADYPLIREYSTAVSYSVEVPPYRHPLDYRNTNGLVKSAAWEISLSKTGFIREAGRCLVMMATIASRPVVIVLLDSFGKNSRIGDANRIKRWMEASLNPAPAKTRSRPLQRGTRYSANTITTRRV